MPAVPPYLIEPKLSQQWRNAELQRGMAQQTKT